MRKMRPTRSSALRVALLLVPALLSLGCVRGCKSSMPPIHLNPNMDNQEKALAQTESAFFYDGMTMRWPVPGTVARGGLREDVAFYTGKDAEGQYLTTIPLEVDAALLARGEERYAIYCLPCHDRRGLGQGILYEYGSVPTASFHDAQRLAYPDGQIFDVITNGLGLMQGYKYPVPPSDRWAIVAHVNRLQEDRLASDVAAVRPQ